MEKTLTLYFKYKDLSGKVGEYEVFATAVVNDVNCLSDALLH